jgi:hypothetical protein
LKALKREMKSLKRPKMRELENLIQWELMKTSCQEKNMKVLVLSNLQDLRIMSRMKMFLLTSSGDLMVTIRKTTSVGLSTSIFLSIVDHVGPRLQVPFSLIESIFKETILQELLLVFRTF